MTNVMKFRRFRYDWTPMGMCTLGGIFQDKIYKFIGDINIDKAYINDILILRKDSLLNT